MPSSADETREILHAARAILTDDHFVYISGDHGSGWIDKDSIFVDLRHTARLGELLAAAVGDLDVNIVCGPATGGLIASQWTAYSLGLPAVFAEHNSPRASAELRGQFAFHRGFDRRLAGKRALVVDDIVNTGHSIRQTIEAARRCGANVVAAAALVDRGNVKPQDLGVEDYRFLLEVDIPSWPAASCELCRQGVPVNTQFAHGQDFLDARAANDSH